MLKTYLYIPDDLAQKIKQNAKDQKTSRAEIMRQALEKGIETDKGRSGAEALLKLVQLAKKNKAKGPHDLSINHDYYLWGMPKKNSRIKP